MKDLEEVVLQELCEEIIKTISPRIVGKLMVTKGLLPPEEFESLVNMRALYRSPESVWSDSGDHGTRLKTLVVVKVLLSPFDF